MTDQTLPWGSVTLPLSVTAPLKPNATTQRLPAPTVALGDIPRLLTLLLAAALATLALMAKATTAP